jgi:hypothetical protein
LSQYLELLLAAQDGREGGAAALRSMREGREGEAPPCRDRGAAREGREGGGGSRMGCGN